MQNVALTKLFQFQMDSKNFVVKISILASVGEKIPQERIQTNAPHFLWEYSEPASTR